MGEGIMSSIQPQDIYLPWISGRIYLHIAENWKSHLWRNRFLQCQIYKWRQTVGSLLNIERFLYMHTSWRTHYQMLPNTSARTSTHLMASSCKSLLLISVLHCPSRGDSPIPCWAVCPCGNETKRKMSAGDWSRTDRSTMALVTRPAGDQGRPWRSLCFRRRQKRLGTAGCLAAL